jgi:hypothetical protein
MATRAGIAWAGVGCGWLLLLAPLRGGCSGECTSSNVDGQFVPVLLIGYCGGGGGGGSGVVGGGNGGGGGGVAACCGCLGEGEE